jgi:mono/diheme cytochrome c family protein
MARLKKVGKWLGILLGVLLVATLGLYGWASSKTSSMFEETYEAHAVDLAIPFPLTDAEIAELRAQRAAEMAPAEAESEPAAEPAHDEEGAAEDLANGEPAEVAAPDPLEGVDLAALAFERAVARGEHLVQARYTCIECHGDDFSGGVMVDDPAIGTLMGPNLTGGEGSRVADWTAAEWDLAVRHGILPGGRASAMPAEDYQRMSDRELSDIIAYIRSFPAVDHRTPELALGPLGTVLMAAGEIPLSVNSVDHDAPHPVEPPESTSPASVPAATAQTSWADRSRAERPTGFRPATSPRTRRAWRRGTTTTSSSPCAR